MLPIPIHKIAQFSCLMILSFRAFIHTQMGRGLFLVAKWLHYDKTQLSISLGLCIQTLWVAWLVMINPFRLEFNFTWHRNATVTTHALFGVCCSPTGKTTYYFQHNGNSKRGEVWRRWVGCVRREKCCLGACHHIYDDGSCSTLLNKNKCNPELLDVSNCYHFSLFLSYCFICFISSLQKQTWAVNMAKLKTLIRINKPLEHKLVRLLLPEGGKKNAARGTLPIWLIQCSL